MLYDDIYNYLIKSHYSVPECGHCQYCETSVSRHPCNKCTTYNNYKLHKDHDTDIKRITKDIIKLVKNVIS